MYIHSKIQRPRDNSKGKIIHIQRGKVHRAIIEIPEGFESNRMDQASIKKLIADDDYLSFRYEGTYGSFSENTWNGP